MTSRRRPAARCGRRRTPCRGVRRSVTPPDDGSTRQPAGSARGYDPNGLARSLRLRSSRLVGLVIPRLGADNNTRRHPSPTRPAVGRGLPLTICCHNDDPELDRRAPSRSSNSERRGTGPPGSASRRRPQISTSQLHGTWTIPSTCRVMGSARDAPPRDGHAGRADGAQTDPDAAAQRRAPVTGDPRRSPPRDEALQRSTPRRRRLNERRPGRRSARSAAPGHPQARQEAMVRCVQTSTIAAL